MDKCTQMARELGYEDCESTRQSYEEQWKQWSKYTASAPQVVSDQLTELRWEN